MAGERYADRAVVTLAAYVRAGIVARLRITETALSLAEGALPDPVEVVERRAPSDLRSPLIEVFDESGGWEEYEQIWATQCTVAVSYCGDGDAEAGDELVRRYMTALLDLLRADERLGTTGVAASVAGYGGGDYHTSTSEIRHFREIGVTVTADERA